MIHDHVPDPYRMLLDDAGAVLPALQEKMVTAITANDTASCTELIEDCVRIIANVCRARHAKNRSNVALPGFEVMALYSGFSVFLGDRLKLGISQNMKNREKSIRHTMSFLGLPPDFKMLSHVWGESAYVKSIEKLALIELAEYRHGGEWFEDAEAVHDWFGEVHAGISDSLLTAVSKVDIESQIREAKTPLFGMFTRFHRPEDTALEGLVLLIKSWLTASESMDVEQKVRDRLFPEDGKNGSQVSA
jgi:hypothetical protein